MKRLCVIGLDITRERSASLKSQDELLKLVRRRDQLALIMKHATHHLRDTTGCKSMKDQLEYWNLNLHRSFVMSELYRPTLKPSKSELKSTRELRATCIESLGDTIDAFLGLQDVTSFAKQSWAALHRSLSSALLLGILKEPAKNERVQILIDKLVAVLLEVNSQLNPSEVSGPIQRSVSALRQLNHLDGAYCASLASNPEISPMSDSASGAVRTVSFLSEVASPASDASSEESPYTMMEKILWGAQPMSTV
jgi:hypothetical protein